MGTLLFGKAVLDVPLAPGIHRHDGYSSYPFTHDQRLELLQKQLAEGAEEHDENSFLVGYLGQDNILQGVLLADTFLLGEKAFGFGMAHVQRFLVDPDSPKTGATESLYRAFLNWAGSRAIQHAACRISCQEPFVNSMFIDFGLAAVDEIVCYLVHPGDLAGFPRHKDFYRVRPFIPADTEAVTTLCIERFGSSRFTRDPRLSQQGCRELFRTWADSLCSEAASRILVATNKEDQVIGFIGWDPNKQYLRHLDLKVSSKALGAIAPNAVGAYVQLFREILLDAFASEDERGPKRPLDLVELETQREQVQVLKVWKRFGLSEAQRSYTYHHWLGK